MKSGHKAAVWRMDCPAHDVKDGWMVWKQQN